MNLNTNTEARPMSLDDAAREPIRSEFADDPEMAEIVQAFTEELPERVRALEAALEAQNLETLRVLAHQLKGAAGGYGFPMLTSAAAGVEAVVKTNEDLSVLQQQVTALIDLCARVQAGSEA